MKLSAVSRGLLSEGTKPIDLGQVDFVPSKDRKRVYIRSKDRKTSNVAKMAEIGGGIWAAVTDSGSIYKIKPHPEDIPDLKKYGVQFVNVKGAKPGATGAALGDTAAQGAAGAGDDQQAAQVLLGIGKSLTATVKQNVASLQALSKSEKYGRYAIAVNKKIVDLLGALDLFGEVVQGR